MGKAGGVLALRIHEKRNNQSVKTQDFGENEDENHSDEQTGLLGGSTNTGVSDDSDSES